MIIYTDKPVQHLYRPTPLLTVPYSPSDTRHSDLNNCKCTKWVKSSWATHFAVYVLSSHTIALESAVQRRVNKLFILDLYSCIEYAHRPRSLWKELLF